MTLLEDYCRIADALMCAPDAPVELLVRKAEILNSERSRLNKINAQLLEACEEALEIFSFCDFCAPAGSFPPKLTAAIAAAKLEKER